jgi:hypothetical protein
MAYGGVMMFDLEIARIIVGRHAPFVQGDAMLENISKAVAEGIAFGRKEALEIGRSGSQAEQHDISPS